MVEIFQRRIQPRGRNFGIRSGFTHAPPTFRFCAECPTMHKLLLSCWLRRWTHASPHVQALQWHLTLNPFLRIVTATKYSWVASLAILIYDHGKSVFTSESTLSTNIQIVINFDDEVRLPIFVLVIFVLDMHQVMLIWKRRYSFGKMLFIFVSLGLDLSRVIKALRRPVSTIHRLATSD